MARVLFTHSYFYLFDPKQWRMKQPYPPLGTIQAAAVARQEGHSVSLFDTNLRTSPLDLISELDRVEPDYLIIYDDSFNYLSKMCLTNMREAAFVMTAEAKKRGCRVIVSSSDAADHYTTYIDKGADYVIRGEGEVTLTELLAALEAGTEVDGIAGLAFAKAGRTVLTAARSLMADLDRLPLPAWDLVNMDDYRKIWKRYHGYFSLNVATTRGCPFKCNWCAKPVYGNRYTSRSPNHVVREIEWLIRHASPDHIWFCDDIFGLKPGWVQEFRELVQTGDLKFRFKIQSRADLLLHTGTVMALAASGAETVWIGAESGSQKILDAMDKGITIQQIKDSNALLRKHGIRVGYFLQFGYPGENQDDIQKTIALVTGTMPDEIGISVSYPLPGTKFYDSVREQLLEKRNWTDSDDLSVMFRGTYAPGYYKKLHQYVHSVYRTHRGKNMLQKWKRDPSKISSRDFPKGLAAIYFAVRSHMLRKKLSKLMVLSTGPQVGKD